MLRLTRLLACLLGLMAPCLATPGRAQSSGTVVFAAASLKTALDAVAERYRTSGKTVTISYAASSVLARQIEQGAPADLFVSADLDWMDYLGERKLIRPETRHNLLGNKLVLIAPSDAAASIELKPGALTTALKGGRLATGMTASVPAGKYGRAALEKLGLWSEVSGQLAESDNVRAALAFVARGEAPLGIVYETDAAAEPKVKIVARFPDGSHPPIVYPAALTAESRQPDAAGVLDFLATPESLDIFRKQGFSPLP